MTQTNTNATDQKETAIFSQIVGTDGIWIKGIRSALRMTGGGRLEVVRGRGITVFSGNTNRLRRHFRYVGLTGF